MFYVKEYDFEYKCMGASVAETLAKALVLSGRILDGSGGVEIMIIEVDFDEHGEIFERCIFNSLNAAEVQ